MQTKFNEIGRSMVEILGVLAVIGVLSVSGIMGYRFAMDKYRANDIINEVNMRNRDTWHQYQNKDLPDTEELNEWADVTLTGFPIGVYPRSNVVFDVQVDNVPSRICKQVLNMNIEGPMFVWTPTEEGKKQLYTGSNVSQLCGEDIETSIIYTTSLETYGLEEGLQNGTTDENGRPLRYCLENEDCLGCQTCDTGTYTCQSTCPDSTPICHSTLQECVSCESNDDCNKNQICSEYNEETGKKQVCITITEKCAEGEFRSKNGACIPCDYAANVLINSDEIFMEDVGTGKELCLSCPNSRRVEGKNDKMYCSMTCTSGISFADTSNSCHACTNEPDWSVLVNDEVNRKKCLACSSDHYWYHDVSNKFICSNIQSCATGEYFFPRDDDGVHCHSCDHSSGVIFISYFDASSADIKQLPKSSCEACPNTPTTKRWWAKYGEDGGKMACFPVCQQPIDVDSCTNPNGCARKFQGSNGTCYDCSVSDSVDVGIDATLHDLCTKCGREINATKCVKKTVCTDTQFRGIDGKCYECTEPLVVEVLDETDSGCVTKCAGVVINNSSGNHTGREILNGYVDPAFNKKVNVCRPKCNETDETGNKMFQGLGRTCYSCDDENSINMRWYNQNYGGKNVNSFAMKKDEYNDIECNSCNTSTEKKRYVGASQCIKYEDCANGFRDKEGNCKECDDAGTYDHVSQDECYRNCKSHRISYIAMDSTGNQTVSFCIYVKPGETGVCNDIGNAHHEGYDDSAKKMFRDIKGNCKYCDIKDTITVGKENYHNNTYAKQQCTHCGNRNYNGNFYCSYGLCDAATEFVNINFECISCTIMTRTEIPLGVEAEDSCKSCSNHRVMKTGSTSDNNLRAYCVQECAPGGFQKTDGKCYFSSSDYGAIGSDEQSKRLCWDSGRVAFTKLSTSGITEWYCSQTATETEHFINIAGQRISCTADDTEIPDSQDARNLCTKCANRSIETVNEKIMCRK